MQNSELSLIAAKIMNNGLNIRDYFQIYQTKLHEGQGEREVIRLAEFYKFLKKIQLFSLDMHMIEAML